MFTYNFIVLVLISYFNVVYTLDSCETRNTCKECIRDQNLCVWCAMNDVDGPRCRSQTAYKSDWCSENLQNPSNFKNATINQNFAYDSEHVIQIKPQQYSMKLRPGKSEEFKFSFKGAPDFPVDLYFLLDASNTMKKVKDMAARQSENIYNTLREMTKNVYLGLGTFVDKRVLPFTVTFNPETTYSFRHQLSLNDNFTKFKEVVTKTSIGTNRDPQEGGLDALAQVMVCTELIGWRKESRKIIVLLTDGKYHAAGDGKSAGLFQPYDGRCYSPNGTYTKELEMDYPSVGMINKLAVDHNIIILFYVHNEVDYIYRGLSGVISSSRVWQYSEPPNGRNVASDLNKANTTDDAIVRALKEIYEDISSKITFKTNVKSGLRKKLDISFKPDCTSEESDSNCDVEIGKEKQFLGTVKLLEYDGQDKVTADIVIESIGEKLTLDIEVIKSCDCESSELVEESSTFCHGEKRVCGICSCSDKRYGDKCACVKSEKNKSINNNSTCISHGSNDICSGHGSCVCGRCECREGYSGKFCNCNQASCPRVHGELCSGITHGDCMCGECVCKPDWNGKACECPSYDCKEDGHVCSNRGHCMCGKCKCDPIAKWDSRKNQDKNCKMATCPECHNLQCRTLEPCVLCHRKGNDDCEFCDDQIQASIVKTLSDEYLNSTTWHVCPNIKVDIGCYTTFVYRYNDHNYSIELIVQQDSNCAETYYIFGGLFLIGLIMVGVCTLIAWKLLTEARDRHEFMNFVKMSAPNEGVVENPLYSGPTSKFDNPGFRKRSFR